MLGTAIALVGVLIFTWVWVIRGFFSAFLHLLCVLAAGAVAFAVYEPLTVLLLTQAPERGIGTILRDTAHGISLGVSFAASLAVLRALVDKAVPANLKFNDTVEYVGAGVCGLATAIVTMGILTLSLGMMRFGPGTPTQTLVYTEEGSGARGSLVRNTSPIRPYVDEWTASLYEWASRGSLATSQPLARWHPDFHELGSAMRITYDGKSRNASRPDEFEVVRWYSLGNAETGGPITQLMTDRWRDTQQRVIGLDGREISRGYLAGVVLKMDPSAREISAGAKVVVGNSQVRLVTENKATGATRAYHPSAVISQAEGDDPSLVRFRYDSDELFIASVGGSGEPVMVFEFAVEPGFHPIAIYFRGARQQLSGEPGAEYDSPVQRDNAVGTLGLAAINLAELDDSYSVELATTRGRQVLQPADYHVYLQNAFAGRRTTLKKGQEQGLEVEQLDSRRGGYVVVGGVSQFLTSSLQSAFVEPNLRVVGFAEPTDIRTVQVDVGRDSPLALNGRVFQEVSGDAAPVLVDDRGQVYPPVGYTCQEDQYTYIGFTPGQPIARLGALPFNVSTSKATQDVRLVYRVSTRVNVVAMVAGDKLVATWEPGIEITSRRR
ncbi:MAG: hypothetical protein AAFX79_01415 [Planctomycetota bacterium]